MQKVNFAREWEVVGAVLSRFNELESRLTKIIVDYIQPDPDRLEFVTARLLHNTNVTFASKVRLVLSISREVKGPKINKDHFHRLMNARNALAHGIRPAAIRRNLNALRPGPYGEFLVVETIRGDGSVEEKPTATVIAEFIDLVEKLAGQLEDLHEKLRRGA